MVFPENYECPGGEVCVAEYDAEFGGCWRRCDLGAETPLDKGLTCAEDETCRKATIVGFEDHVFAVVGICVKSCKLIGAPRPCP
jgi:hypothetical protein